MGWPVVALGEVAKPIKRLTVVEPGKIYRLLACVLRLAALSSGRRRTVRGLRRPC